MNQRLKLGDRVLDVKIANLDEDAGIRFEIDRKAGTATVISSVPGRHVVRMGDRTVTLHSVLDREGAWVWCEGRSWRVRVLADAEVVETRPEPTPSGCVTSPMPAVVVRILAEPGQQVTRGQVLIVVSAMKLQTALTAPCDGTVTAVLTAIGASVMPGEVLVEVAPEGTG